MNRFEWSVIGAGPAGMAVVGLLIDNGINPKDILWIDPDFNVGDFGQKWGEVSGNTSVELFLRFLTDINSFDFEKHSEHFKLETYPRDGFTQLKDVATPLQWVTNQLMAKVVTAHDTINTKSIENGAWELVGKNTKYYAKKVVLATGSTPNTLKLHNTDSTQEIDLDIALCPSKLKENLQPNDKVAVFGASHSAMIIIRSLIEAGVTDIANFYLSPLRYAVKMADWTLYDNTGLKGETAKWARNNISQNLDPRIHRYISNRENIEKHLNNYNKVIYATGFTQRAPQCENINTCEYDKSNGIIAPGLFGCGIGFPRQITDPNGNKELNVGLFKFMNDIRNSLPLWMRYGI